MRSCRVCSCTDDDPCYDEDFEQTCRWVEADLCSSCVDVAEGTFPKLKRAGFVM